MPELKDPRGVVSTRNEASKGLSAESIALMKAILAANKEKNFVQRITNAGDWPVQRNPDGSYSSHRMGSSEVDGRNIVYPTLVYDPSTNSLKQPSDPVRQAISTGEYIEFPNSTAAEAFAGGGYKVGLNTGLLQQMRR
jgi:hypothetical protein